MLLFKKILDFSKIEVAPVDKRTALRYPVGIHCPLKARLSLVARDDLGNPLPPAKQAPMEWGGQLVNLSASGASIRVHPAAIAERGERCTLKLELDAMLFEVDGTVSNYRLGPQFATCGISYHFPDKYTERAYQQLMEPVVIGSTLAARGEVAAETSGLLKEGYAGEGDSVLTIWREEVGGPPKYFELLVRDYYVRGTANQPGLAVGYRDGAKVGRRVSRPSMPVEMSAGHQAEVGRFFEYIVPNLTKSVPSDIRRFLESFGSPA